MIRAAWTCSRRASTTLAAALTRENHTLKRALTDPHLLSGIGNAYSDEILHAARLSPMQLTSRLSRDEIAALHAETIRISDQVARRSHRRDRRALSRKGHRVSRRHGGPWPLRQAVPGVRHRDSADPVRVERSELLPDVPDGREAAGRSRFVAVVEERLAEVAGRARAVQERGRRPKTVRQNLRKAFV